MIPTLCRPDTAYFFSRIEWSSDAAKAIHAAHVQTATPSARAIIERLEGWISSQSPDEQERLLALPHAELMRDFKDIETEDKQEVIPDCTVEIGGREFAFTPWSPRRGCNFKLESNGCTIHGKVRDPSRLPNCYLEIGSPPFWLCKSWTVLLLGWHAWLQNVAVGGAAQWHITRLDIAMHTQAITSDQLSHRNFKCRAWTRSEYTKKELIAILSKAHAKDKWCKETGVDSDFVGKVIEMLDGMADANFVDYYRGEVRQGTSIGKRGMLMARPYNKTAQIGGDTLKKAVFIPVWGAAGFDMNRDVVNVEFEMHRAWFQSKELKIEGKTVIIDTMQDLLLHYQALCAFLIGTKTTEGWLTMIDRTTELGTECTRATRCDTHEAWEILRELSGVLKEVSAHKRQRVHARNSFARNLPHMVKSVARADVFTGRIGNVEDISPQLIIERMAEVILKELERESDEVLSDKAIMGIYRSERIRALVALAEFEAA